MVVEDGNPDSSKIILASNNLGYRLQINKKNAQAIDYYKHGIKVFLEFTNNQENDSIIFHILRANLGYLEALG